MDTSVNERYKAAGVDVTAGYKSVELMKKHVTRTNIPGVLSGLGGFGGLFAPNFTGMQQPVLVSGTDGVGTKLRLAFVMDKHDTVGIDCVAMCVNDIVCAGAAPLFFLDYLAVGKNLPEKIEQIVSGIAEGCVQAGCALIGGETAEMPGFYPENEYDMAGFAVGMVDKSKMLDRNNVQDGDVLIALASSGVHSNGFSLVRKLFDLESGALERYVAELGNSLGQTLLAPTRIYVQSVLELLGKVPVHAVCHITGGGFFENIPRALPEGWGAVIQKSQVQTPPVFSLIRKVGDIPEKEMFGTFNMGVGMCVIVPPDKADEAVRHLDSNGEDAYILGEVKKDTQGVVLL